MPPVKHVAIVGGGPAGLVAALEIAENDPNAQITVYQMGWRLGGKLATVRNPNAADRIEEHGIHIFFGAYENTFHVLERVHQILGSNTWKPDFKEHGHASLMEWVDGAWRSPWAVEFPRRSGDPGDAIKAGDSGSMSNVALAKRLLEWLSDWVVGQIGDPLTRWLVKNAFDMIGLILASLPVQPAAADVDRINDELSRVLRILRTTTVVTKAFWTAAGWIGFDTADRIDRLRRLWIIADIASAAGMGLLRAAQNGQSTKDTDAHELRTWLSNHAPLGALSAEASDSAPLRMVYEVVFAYENGDDTKPRIAAGTAVRGLMRLLFDYRGAFVYKMRKGSETFVTPLYKALLAKNVRFEFFHRLDQIELSADKRRIEKLHFTRQATSVAGYNPLNGQGQWPDCPNYGQLTEGNTLKQSNELAAGGYDLEATETASSIGYPFSLARKQNPTDTGFDAVVLAASVGALLNSAIGFELGGELDPENTITPAQLAFRNMAKNSSAIPTQAAQLWFKADAATMGWPFVGDLVGTFAQPFGNWADLEVTLPHENWPSTQPAKHPAYLAGPYVEPQWNLYAPDLWRTQTEARVRDWLVNHAKTLWPNAYDPTGTFRWDLLVDLGNNAGEARLGAQCFRVNRNAAERYTLTLPGSTQFRLRPDGAGFDNLVLAGDWTDNGFNVGAVEAAVMSGRQAARAILGSNFPVYGES